MLPLIPKTKRTEPLIPADHPKFVWTAGADVQATWRRYGWLPLEEDSAAKQSDEFITLALAKNFTMVI